MFWRLIALESFWLGIWLGLVPGESLSGLLVVFAGMLLWFGDLRGHVSGS